VSKRHQNSTASSGSSQIASLSELPDFQRHHFDCLHAVRPPLVKLQAASASPTCVRPFISTKSPPRRAAMPAHAVQPTMNETEPARCQPLREPVEKYRPASSEVRRSSIVRVFCVSVCVHVECLLQRGFCLYFFRSHFGAKSTHTIKNCQFKCRFLDREFSCEDINTSRRTRIQHTYQKNISSQIQIEAVSLGRC
jgi:hypothetical protein